MHMRILAVALFVFVLTGFASGKGKVQSDIEHIVTTSIRNSVNSCSANNASKSSNFTFGPLWVLIKTSNPALNGAFLNINAEYPDVVRRDDLVKMISQISPTTITPQEYSTYLLNVPTFTLPKSRLLGFVRSRNFGGRRFLNWLNSQPENVSLGFFATRVIAAAGQTTLPFTFPHTTLRRLAGVPGSVPEGTPPLDGQVGVGRQDRFFLWGGLPQPSAPEGEKEEKPATDKSLDILALDEGNDQK